jgi:hypothetical protein
MKRCYVSLRAGIGIAPRTKPPWGEQVCETSIVPLSAISLQVAIGNYVELIAEKRLSSYRAKGVAIANCDVFWSCSAGSLSSPPSIPSREAIVWCLNGSE